jgi:hypothetical protein
VLEGDNNSKFFHLYANGRRRKKTIITLDTDQGVVNTQEGIMKHVTEFYKTLFGSGRVGGVSLLENFWEYRHILSEEEKEILTKPFQEAEVKRVIFDMKADSCSWAKWFWCTFLQSLLAYNQG